MKRLTQARIDALRTMVAHADIEDIGLRLEADAPAELAEDLRAYVRRFAKPEDARRLCLACGAPCGGFVWGLVHGLGHCHDCGWPARLYHFIKDRHGKDLYTVRGILLQAHPDDVSIRK